MKKTLKVILLKNVANLGKAGDLKDVSLGYARNFLLANNLAEEATAKAIAELDVRRAKMAKEAELELGRAEELARKLEGQTVEITAKASDEGTLYAAISSAKIASALKSKGFDVAKDQISASHIKELGEHEIVINLDHGLEARITLIINSE
ncbi:MAG: 50S ribosomal protein L9 [Candidatus Buchananbacteria bacterium]|nr:50S ribosomal protein L9 [Candidatus Buchananbacteria bacterium]